MPTNLQEAIERARAVWPLETIMAHFGDGSSYVLGRKTASPFRDDGKKPSFQVENKDGVIKWKDWGGERKRGEHWGDEADYIEDKLGISNKEALGQWFSLAGVNFRTGEKKGSNGTAKKSKVADAIAKARAWLDEAGVAERVKEINWDGCVARFSEKWVKQVASDRGYRPEFVRWMVAQKMIGIWVDHGGEHCVAFPVTDADGEVRNVHYKRPDGGWMYIKDRLQAALHIGDTSDPDNPLMVMESQWDAFAVYDKCRVDQGQLAPSILCTRGCSNVEKFAKQFLLDRPAGALPIIGFEQNDKPEIDQETGEPKKKGNFKWKHDLQNIRPDIMWTAPPEGIKDANDWARAGATEDDIRDAIEDSKPQPLTAFSLLVPSDSRNMKFDPKLIYYQADGAKYLVFVGSHFRVYSRKTPVVEGVARHLANKDKDGDPKDLKARAKQEVADIEIDRAVDWSGAIAGHRQGLHKLDVGVVLVTSEPDITEPEAGSFPTIHGIIHDTLGGSPYQVLVFEAWLAKGYEAVRAGVHQPGQMMTLAGEPNTGKSLLAWISGQTLGRTASPYVAWTGTLPWNDDVIGAEFLLIDDSVGSTDMRARREFAARFKEAIYGPSVQLRKRHVSSLNLRPVWRVMVCCNSNSESMQIIPPLDDDLADKVTILQVERVSLPVDTSTPDGRTQLQKMILSELPAYTHYLNKLEIPEHLRDSRSGIKAWRHPNLVASLESISPEHILSEMISCLWECEDIDGDPCKITAAKLQETLMTNGSPCAQQARALLSRWSAACGTYLGKLARRRPDMVSKGAIHNGHQIWNLHKPKK